MSAVITEFDIATGDENVLVTVGTLAEREKLASALEKLLKRKVFAVTPLMERKATANSVPVPEEVTFIVAFGISSWHIIIDKKGNGESGIYSTPEEFAKILSDYLVTGAMILVAGAPSRIPKFGEDEKWVTTDSLALVGKGEEGEPTNFEKRLRPKAFHIKDYLAKIPPDHKIVVGNPSFPGESYVTDTMEGVKFSGGNASDMARALGVDVSALPEAIEEYVASRK